MQYTAENILIHPTRDPQDPDLILSITPKQAGWDYISFQARRLMAGKTWAFSAGENELAVVVLSGCFTINSKQGAWAGLDRINVFSGPAYVVYLPRRTDFTI
jgi:5-deoxy-glucuronate isomerase